MYVIYLQHVSVTFVCVLWVNLLQKYISRNMFSYDNSFRILNNLPMTCSTMHMFAKAGVFSGKGII